MPPSPSKDELIARFPGPVVLLPSRMKWSLILITSLIFVAGGIWAILEPFNQPTIGWSSVIFFTLCAITALVGLQPGANRLTLDAEGFEVRQFYRPLRMQWRQVSDFTVSNFSVLNVSQRMVGYFDNASRDSALGKVVAKVSGRNAGLPDTYGMAPEDLASLLNEWRSRALEGAL